MARRHKGRIKTEPQVQSGASFVKDASDVGGRGKARFRANGEERLAGRSVRTSSERPPLAKNAAYSGGAGFTGIGPSPAVAADFSNLGLKASITRSVSENQPFGAGTVGPVPGPGTM
jgi:hypothetical protein